MPSQRHTGRQSAGVCNRSFLKEHFAVVQVGVGADRPLGVAPVHKRKFDQTYYPAHQATLSRDEVWLSTNTAVGMLCATDCFDVGGPRTWLHWPDPVKLVHGVRPIGTSGFT